MIIQPGTYGILNADGTLREIVTFATSATVKDDRAKPVSVTAKPLCDPATQKVVQSGWLVNASGVTPIWQTVALSQAELDAISQASEASIIRPAIALFKAGTATNAQTQRAIAYLLKQSLG